MSTHDRYKLPILLFDDDCPLCLRFKQSLERLSGHEAITKVSIHDKEVYQVFTQINFESCKESVHFIEVNGEVFKGSDAVQKMIHHLPAVESFGWLADSEVGKKAIQYFHDMAEHYRKQLQKGCRTCKKNHA